MRKRAPGAGNARELRVMDVLAAEGWLCASRRHIGGAGDVLAVRHDGTKRWSLQARLIEVKSTAGGPWERFGPADRQTLIETARACGAQPWLYWWPPRKSLHRIHSEEFPKSRLEPEPLPGHGTVETHPAPYQATWPGDEDIARDLP